MHMTRYEATALKDNFKIHIFTRTKKNLSFTGRGISAKSVLNTITKSKVINNNLPDLPEFSYLIYS